MKVGIATITYTKENIPYNYGNVFQNYALTIYLKNNGYEPETIYYLADYFKTGKSKYSFGAPKMQREYNCLQIIDDAIRVCKRNFHREKLKNKTEMRNKQFKAFIEKHIIYSENDYDYSSDFSSLNEYYDCFITGSDQVWNPYWEGSNEFFYLTFTDRKKRISYAPSITVDDIPDEIIDDYKKWIAGFDYLSVREEDGRKLISDLFGAQAKWVCDPVFLLSKNEWLELCSTISRERYFLVYVLGKKTPFMKKRIRELEKKTGAKAIDVYTRDNPDALFAGPNDFLSLIHCAEFLYTDSFHGVAFSLIFDTPFVVEKRDQHEKEIDSRIRSLLELSDAGNRSAEYLIGNPEQIMMNAYDKTKLDTFISDSKDYLIKALSECLQK